MKRSTDILVTAIILSILLWLPAYSQYSKEFRKTAEIEAGGRLEIDTYKGSIEVETWDREGIEIYARIVADGRSRDDREMVEDTEIRVHAGSDRVEVITDYGKSERSGFSIFKLFQGNSGSLPLVHYSIKVPRSVRLKIKDYKSDTKITDISTPLRMETYKGSVIVVNHSGALDIETYKGDLRVDFAKFSDDCSFETYKGRIRVAVPKGDGFRLKAELGRRADFSCDFGISSSKRSRRDDYLKADINGGGHNLYLNTEKGEIRLIEK